LTALAGRGAWPPPAAAEDSAVDFLRCRTPARWVDAAIGNIELLLQDHATLELKAAQQAQTLIRKYGAGERPDTGATSGGANGTAAAVPAAGFRAVLIAKMSRLAREELRHFERVVEVLEARRIGYRPVSASRYAAGMHALVARREPLRLVDTLLVGAIIEARSCERFAALAPALDSAEPALARFYSSLLRSEARHFEDYLALARQVVASADPDSPAAVAGRLDALLERDAELILTEDSELRFHSGVPAEQVLIRGRSR
jgi:tRNA-(ms[2]io[6]A)-hydroxylase